MGATALRPIAAPIAAPIAPPPPPPRLRFLAWCGSWLRSDNSEIMVSAPSFSGADASSVARTAAFWWQSPCAYGNNGVENLGVDVCVGARACENRQVEDIQVAVYRWR